MAELADARDSKSRDLHGRVGSTPSRGTTMPHHWDSFLYFFLVGTAVFLIGVVMPLIRKDLHWRKASDRKTLFWMIGGYLFYLVGYLAWQYYAIGKL